MKWSSNLDTFLEHFPIWGWVISGTSILDRISGSSVCIALLGIIRPGCEFASDQVMGCVKPIYWYRFRDNTYFQFGREITLA